MVVSTRYAPVVMELTGFLGEAETEQVILTVLCITTHMNTYEGCEVWAEKIITGYASWKRGYLSFMLS